MPQFVVIARDGRDAEALARRLAARPAHFEGIKPMAERGEILVGGAMLDGADKMVGSVVIVEFDSRADLDAWLAREPYVTGDVWRDIEIVPFRTAVPDAFTPKA